MANRCQPPRREEKEHSIRQVPRLCLNFTGQYTLGLPRAHLGAVTVCFFRFHKKNLTFPLLSPGPVLQSPTL